jgi:hypothetical protein
MAFQTVILLALACAISAQTAKKIVLTNDDGWCHKSNLYDVHRPHYHNIGWAVAQIRAQNDALKAAGYNVRRPLIFLLDL